MKEILKDMLLKLISAVKIKTKFALVAGIIIATILYIYLPFFLGNPYIRIKDPIFVFEVSLPFNQCEIYVKNSITVDNNGTRIDPYSRGSDHVASGNKLKIAKNANPIIIENSLRRNQIESIKADAARISIKYKASDELDITKVLINGKERNLKSFFEDNIKVQAKTYMDRQLITEAISTILLHYNVSVSNFLLTLLTIFFFLLFCNLGYKCVIYYLAPSHRFAEFALRSALGPFPKDESDLKDKRIDYCLKFQEQDIWYRFLQILGPTVGFLLTTSSLIAALNPSLQASRDIKGFFDSIQVAMVSTFIGLLIRLVAMFLQRLNNKMLVRLDNTLFGEIVGQSTSTQEN